MAARVGVGGGGMMPGGPYGSRLCRLLLGLLWLALGVRGQVEQQFGENTGWNYPPQITWLSPPKGHIKGGTFVTIYGTGFTRSPFLQCRFAVEDELDTVFATYLSDSMAVCESPERDTVHTAHVTMSNDGITYSGFPNVYIKGSGTFLKFVYDNSDPGCLDCKQTVELCGAGEGNGGINCLNPYYVNEIWDVDNATGPYIGGTEVTISAVGLNFPNQPYDMFVQGGGYDNTRYNQPVGGPGTPHPFSPDPTAVGNGPPVTGTFYPHKWIKCLFECFMDINQDGTPEVMVTSDWVDAKWIDYTKIMCITPPMPLPGKQGENLVKTPCTIRVSNNQQGLDQGSGTTTRHRGFQCPGQCGQLLGGAACDHACDGTFAVFTYQDLKPEVRAIRSAQTSVWPARGPFQGNTEVTIIGINFLPSRYIKCRFGGMSYPNSTLVMDDMTHVVGQEGGRVRYISSTEIICISPVFGPASAAEQYPEVYTNAATSHKIMFPTKSPGSGAILEVASYSSDAIASITVISPGRNYASEPTLSFHGGGGCCINASAVLDANGIIARVDVFDGGKNWNRGRDGTATAILSTGGSGLEVVADMNITNPGYGYLWPPDVEFVCNSASPTLDTCFVKGEVSRGGSTPQASPNRHAKGVAVIAGGKLVRIDVTYPGAFYSVAPDVVITPAKPRIKIVAKERYNRNRDDPLEVGGYSKQGKSPEELDPEGNGGVLLTEVEGEEGTDVWRSYPRHAGGVENGQRRYPHGGGHTHSIEDRGPLLPPLGQAFMDGSIKPGHQALIRVSNNYHLPGVNKDDHPHFLTTDIQATGAYLEHKGYRDTVTQSSIQSMGYWIWSDDGMDEDSQNRCRVSNNPPIHQFGFIQGHGLDAHHSLGRADDEHDNIGDSTGFTYLDGSSVRGAPGMNATANVTLIPSGIVNGNMSVGWIEVVNAGFGYNAPPSITIVGGGGHGAKAHAVLSGGTLFRVVVDYGGIGYWYDPDIIITPVTTPTRYDALVGHNVYNLDQSALSVHQGEFQQTSNYQVGHGAFPSHPGNLNQGHPSRDCIYFLYSDIYVSPSGSDTTGQGTAGRPYRTIQKCIDSALQDPRAFYVYKRFDGGDRDPSIPDGTARYGTESPNERVSARADPYYGTDRTDRGQFGEWSGKTDGKRFGGASAAAGPEQYAKNVGGVDGTGYDKGYTGRPVTSKVSRRTGWTSMGNMYGGGRWESDQASMQKGFGYYVNRDRCILKDGVYSGDGCVHPPRLVT
mmetsp:Transcript_32921/g.104806  ORF Transcript_32921/g.104806 Transcript_32921/m.104806 type:complete len:1244 (-) Transcript_32921:714-4445(-)